jgi:hypothetical protein
MELRSLALGESPPEVLGMERIPRASRMRMTNVNMISIDSTTVVDVEDDDFRPGSREYRGFAIVLVSAESNSERNPRDRSVFSEI